MGEKTNSISSLRSAMPAVAAHNFSQILATAYLRLLARHGPNWRGRLELAENQKGEKSAKTRSNRLDFSANRPIRCPGQRTITVTLTRS
jgi:Na+/citrate or Na+/malate symporter